MVEYLENEKDFEEIINGKVLIDFFTTWCGPCRMMSDELLDLDQEGFTKEIRIVKIDAEKFPNISQRFMINAVPTIMYFENGVRKNVSAGYKNKNELKRFCGK
ncbi:MAG: thioredoxin domain-containing protein [Bacilli bacterium]|nr:thioredoxin domain-containing protein [Bacilli bacterium]